MMYRAQYFSRWEGDYLVDYVRYEQHRMVALAHECCQDPREVESPWWAMTLKKQRSGRSVGYAQDTEGLRMSAWRAK